MTRCWLDGGVVPQHVGVVDPRIQGGRGCGATMASFDVYFQDAFKKAVWKPRPSKKIVRTLASFWSFLLLYLYLYLQVDRPDKTFPAIYYQFHHKVRRYSVGEHPATK